jgi:hypothetical protein
MGCFRYFSGLNAVFGAFPAENLSTIGIWAGRGCAAAGDSHARKSPSVLVFMAMAGCEQNFAMVNNSVDKI